MYNFLSTLHLLCFTTFVNPSFLHFLYQTMINNPSSHLHPRPKSEKKPLPAVVESLKKRANAYFEKEQYTKAIILYNQAIMRAPHASMLYGNRAAAYMKRKW